MSFGFRMNISSVLRWKQASRNIGKSSSLEIAQRIESHGKAEAPSDTGRLAASIHTTKTSRGVAVSTGRHIKYGRFPYFGTKWVAENRFFKVPNIEKEFEKKLIDEIERDI